MTQCLPEVKHYYQPSADGERSVNVQVRVSGFAGVHIGWYWFDKKQWQVLGFENALVVEWWPLPPDHEWWPTPVYNTGNKAN